MPSSFDRVVKFISRQMIEKNPVEVVNEEIELVEKTINTIINNDNITINLVYGYPIQINMKRFILYGCLLAISLVNPIFVANIINIYFFCKQIIFYGNQTDLNELRKFGIIYGNIEIITYICMLLGWAKIFYLRCIFALFLMYSIENSKHSDLIKNVYDQFIRINKIIVSSVVSIYHGKTA